ncbi:heterokaryon incompatibility domain-containing protein [Trichoderma barbatum]
MNLLNVNTLRLEKHVDGTPYAILSHRWDSEEFLYHHITSDMTESERGGHPGYSKVRGACKQARLAGHSYIWIDTCCIDKSSSAELNEAINCMFKGWTLQELIAPTEVLFFTDGDTKVLDSEADGYPDMELGSESDRDQSEISWVCLGRKSSMCERLSSITGIDATILSHSRDIRSISVAKRMSWASKRITTRVEDRAYCLLGLFDISMPMLYGEGEKSFIRLQEEIMKDSSDESLFLWTDDTADSNMTTGLLATSPNVFQESGHFFPYYDWEARAPFFKTNQGLQITLPLRRIEDDTYVASLNCCQPSRTDGFAGLCLKRVTNFTDSSRSGYYDQYVRIKSDRILAIDITTDRGNVTTFYVRQSTALSPSTQVYPEQIVQLRHGPTANQGYRLHGTMGRQPSTLLNMTSPWGWVPKGVEAALRVPKDANSLAAVVSIARMDNSKFTILLGSSSDPGEVVSHVLDGCDEKRLFSEWASSFKPQPPGYMNHLQHEHVWIRVDSRVVHAQKYFMVDVNIEKYPSIFDEVIDVIEETPLREALTVMDRLIGVDTVSLNPKLIAKTSGKVSKLKGVFSRRSQSNEKPPC